MKERLAQKIKKLGLTPTEDDLKRFELFYHFLIEENQKFNLTGITDEDGVIDKHFIDSLAGAAFLRAGDTVIDVGSGAGFPAIPLAIMNRKAHFTLIDSLGKRAGFLNALINKLELANATAQHTRAEDFARDTTRREGYSVSLARAVAPLNTLSEYCLPLTAVGGRFIAYKTPDENELKNAEKAISILGGRLHEVKQMVLPDTDISRTIIVIEKVSKTPAAYPRGQNKEKTKPL